MDEFRDLVGQMPIDMEIFYPHIQQGHSSAQTLRRIPELDYIPQVVTGSRTRGIHQHDAFELLYVLDGQASMFLGGDTRDFSAGDICLLASGFPHDVVPKGKSLVVSIILSEHTIENTLYRLLQSENVVTDFFRAALGQNSCGYLLFNLPVDRRSCLSIRNIFHTGYSREPYSSQIFTDFLEVFFCYILQRSAATCEQYSEMPERTGPPGLLPVLQYIQSNYKTTSLEETAGHFHYSSTYLGKRIKAHMGRGYSDIVAELRISEAKKLLADSSLSLGKVSEQSGFHSTEYFSRTFKKYAGMSPREYRKALNRK